MIRTALILLLGTVAHGQEISLDHITAAVCQVESGCIYRGFGAIDGQWQVGGIGEVGYWQISPMVLRDLKASRAQASSARHGELLFRKWFLRLYAQTGSVYWSVAAYNGGMGGRTRSAATDYADRVMNLAERLAMEDVK